ncbi:siderophore-interacting protein [Humibacter sp. BT305]|nr:siderophore-interacting protein [Humibacter sp. BT305]
MPRLSTQTPTAPFRLHEVTLVRRRRISPSFVRFTFAGPELDQFADNGLDQRIKLIFPLEGVGLAPVPMGDDWYAQWRELPDELRNPIRTYTIRAVRQEQREIDVDIVLHGVTGPASRWASSAEPGDSIVVLGPNAAYDGFHGGVDFLPPRRSGRVLLAGDETALPAIANILEALPADARGCALVEVPHPDDAVALPTHPGFEVIVLARDGGQHGDALSPLVRDKVDGLLEALDSEVDLDDVDVDAGLLWEVPSDDAGHAALDDAPLYAWLAGEASVIKLLRRHLVAERGMDRKAVAFMGYWRLGRSEQN